MVGARYGLAWSNLTCDYHLVTNRKPRAPSPYVLPPHTPNVVPDPMDRAREKQELGFL